MGVTLSTNSTLAPISLVSTIIGFISFAFTVSTFLRVFWDNLHTLFQAETEIHDYLSNLRTQLYEERASLRSLRRHNKDWGHTGHRGKAGARGIRLDDRTIKSMQESIRHLLRRFKALEQPFLEGNNAASRRRPSHDPYGRESGRWSDDDLKAPAQNARQAVDDADEDWPGNPYCDITLVKRFAWLRRRTEAIALLESLSRVQTRRIARQVGEISVALYEYGGVIEHLGQDMEHVTGRLNRVVGIRRVD